MANTDMNNLEEVVLKKIVEKLEIDDIDIATFPYDATLFEFDCEKTEISLDLDSVSSLELVVMIYDEWGIKAEQSDMARLRTVKSIADFIREKLNDKS